MTFVALGVAKFYILHFPFYIPLPTLLLISPYWKEDHRWMVSSYKLAELWQRLGYRVVVMCMGHDGSAQHSAVSGQLTDQDTGRWSLVAGRSSDIPQTLEIHRVPDYFLKDPWNYGIAFGFAGKALKLAREIKPDIIVVNKVLFWSSFALLRLRLAGFKVILTTDALVGMTWWPRTRIAKICAAIYAWTAGWLILKAATKIVFFHPQPAALLKRIGIAEKSVVIPTGIDLQDQGSGIRDQGSGKIIVTYVGRLESVKGVDDFVAAALKVKRDHPELRIQVVGWYPSTSSGQAKHPLVTQFKDQVVFTGLRHDIPAVLAATDIFVLPSYSEGLSNALMEAMAAGCACIASDVGGNAFLIQNGISGFLFPAGDREALSAHIRRLVTDPAKREALGDSAHRRILDHFSWGVIGMRWSQLFGSLRR